MDLTVQTFLTVLESLPRAERYLIAYSGGLDSHVLLHLCAAIGNAGWRSEFAAMHVHHGLQPDAERWSEHCAATCARLGIPFRLIRVDATATPGQSPEEAARNARYAALKSGIGRGECVLTAQHRDDQAETMLLQVFRGGGLAGLSAMPTSAVLGPGMLQRPLLAFSRDSIEAYAKAHQLAWVEDPSNRNKAYDRNFLRHEVMPLLKQRWPGVVKAVRRSAGHCAEAKALIDGVGESLYRSVKNPADGTLNLGRLQELDLAARRLALRVWIRHHGLRMPSANIIQRILGEVSTARPDGSPRVCWSEAEIRRFRDRLYLLPRLTELEPGFSCDWDGKTPLALPDGNGRLEVFKTDRIGISPRLWHNGPITVRYRQGGESCRLPGRQGRHKLKNLFQERAVPPWVRERVPLIYIGDELAAIGGLWVCAPFLGEGEGRDLTLRWSDHGLYGKAMTRSEMSTKIAH
ncbi:MAG: tRNA lysidine(34) synthetase TilS [Pseudomonadota bacterium]